LGKTSGDYLISTNPIFLFSSSCKRAVYVSVGFSSNASLITKAGEILIPTLEEGKYFNAISVSYKASLILFSTLPP
jgi:hypothetical protein